MCIYIRLSIYTYVYGYMSVYRGIYIFEKYDEKNEFGFYENKCIFMRIYILISIYVYAYGYRSIYMGVYTFLQKRVYLSFLFKGMAHRFCKNYSLLGFLKTWANDKLFL